MTSHWKTMSELERVNALEALVRELFPAIPHSPAGMEEIDYLLWNHTGYPVFWLPDVNGGPLTHYRHQFEAWRDGKVDDMGEPVDRKEGA